MFLFYFRNLVVFFYDGVQARRLEEGTGLIVRNESPNRESSLGTSVEVQMGNSVEEERMAIQHRTNQKLRHQVIKVSLFCALDK